MKNGTDVSQRSPVEPLLELREEELGAVVGGKEPQIDIKVLKDGTIIITIKPGSA
jgi:hypothetical protein